MPTSCFYPNRCKSAPRLYEGDLGMWSNLLLACLMSRRLSMVPSSGSPIGNIVLIVQICTAYPRPPVTERDFAIGAGGYDRIS